MNLTRCYWSNPLYSLVIILFFLACNSKGKIENKSDFSDFRFRKIQAYIDDSAHYFKAMDSVYADLPYFRRTYEMYNCKRGYFFTVKRDYIKALNYSDSILQLLGEHSNNQEGYSFWYPQALALKADDLHALKRYTESFTFYYLAREAIYKSGDTCLFADYSNKLGLVSFQHNQYKAAAEYFKQAIQQKIHCGTDNANSGHVLFAVLQSTLDNIGICYSRLNMLDSSLYYFDSALRYIDHNYQNAFRYNEQNQKIADTNFIESARGVIYGNMATDLAAIGNDSAAERLLKSSIYINSQPIRAKEDVPYSQGKLAGLYIKQLRLNEANEALNALRKGLDTLANEEMERRWLGLQSDYFAARKDFFTSNEYLKKYMARKDSVTASEYDKLAPDLDETFGYLKTQQDLYTFQRDDERKSLYLVLFSIGLILVTIIMLLIWNSYRVSQKHINTLAALNEKLIYKQTHLEKALTALQTSHEENNRIVKIVAHDLRNPVSGIAGMSDFLLKEDNYNSTQRKMLEMIRQSSYHSIELIQDMAQFNSRIGEISKEPVDVTALLLYCVDLLQLKAEEKSQKIITHTMPLTILADREKVWRVFSNLIGNAIKFSEKGLQIEVNISSKNAFAVISVKDHGIGIPETIKEKIFTADTDIKRKGTAGEASFGLGLTICKQIVENHNGSLWFESEVGSGTTFYVSFPLVAEATGSLNHTS